MTPHCLVGGYQLFSGTAVSIYRVYFPKTEASSSYDSLAPIYATTQRPISEVRNPEANKEVHGQHVVSNVHKLQSIRSPQLSYCNTDYTSCMALFLSVKNMCDEDGLPDHPVYIFDSYEYTDE